MAEQTEGIHSMLLLVGNPHNIIFPLPRKIELFSSIETGGLEGFLVQIVNAIVVETTRTL
jgi:hypothetical protein